MKLPPLHVVLAALALLWAAILTAGTALAAPAPEERKLKLTANEAVLEKRVAQGREKSNVAHAKAAQRQFDPLCTFRSAMTHADIYGCISGRVRASQS